MLFVSNFMEVAPFLLAALIPALCFHEFGHAFMAHLFGDDTAKLEGRMTLDPLAHLDWMGTFMFVLVGFGYAKPVPVNPSNYRSKSGLFWVPAAGPLMNLLLAILFAGFIRFGIHEMVNPELGIFLYKVFYWSIMVNLFLMFFNLIPIGPLDGRQIVESLLPFQRAYSFRMWNDQYGGYALMGLIFLEMLTPIGVFSHLIRFPSNMVAGLLLG